MSAPETNIEKQKRRHGPVLLWLLAAVALVVLAAIAIDVSVDEERDLETVPSAMVPAGRVLPGDG